MRKQMGRKASHFHTVFKHSQRTSDIFEALCRKIFATTMVFIEDLPPTSHQWGY